MGKSVQPEERTFLDSPWFRPIERLLYRFDRASMKAHEMRWDRIRVHHAAVQRRFHACCFT